MQISTVRKFQRILDNSIKVLKFVWRHAFVLASFAITIQGICEGKIPIIEGEAIIFAVAVFIDWFKIQFQFSQDNSSSCEQMFESARRNRDSNRFGSSAWATNPVMAGSPANHLSNLGYTTTNYN
jgi:hypothetical protein